MPRPIAPPKPKWNWRRWMKVVSWTTVCLLLLWGERKLNAYILRDPDFTLHSLDVKGAVYASPARLQAVFESDLGKSVFTVPLSERRRHLLAIDWVQTASITRVWPNKLLITITERKPVAFARLPLAGSTRHWNALIDSEGVLLSIPSRVRFRLPLLSGVTEEQTDEERRIRVEAMNHLIADMGPDAKYLSEINVASTQELRVMASVDNQPVELWMGDQHYRSRFRNFVASYSEIRKHSERNTIFDLRLDDRILAR